MNENKLDFFFSAFIHTVSAFKTKAPYFLVILWFYFRFLKCIQNVRTRGFCFVKQICLQLSRYFIASAKIQ